MIWYIEAAVTLAGCMASIIMVALLLWCDPRTWSDKDETLYYRARDDD